MKINIEKSELLELLTDAFYAGMHKSNDIKAETYSNNIVEGLIIKLKEEYSQKPSNTIEKFILKLQQIKDDFRNLPLVIDCPNGVEVYPSIKMRWDEPLDILNKTPDKMVITWMD